MYWKTIICLAKSIKHGAYCVAGREFDGTRIGPWNRPVSDTPGHAVTDSMCKLSDGSTLQVLDIVEVPLLKHQPELHQVENHVLAPSPWHKVGKTTWTQVYSCEDPPDPSYWQAALSSRLGKNDKLPIARAIQLASSIKIVHVNDLKIIIQSEVQGLSGIRKKVVRARFTYSGVEFFLKVTDPYIWAQFGKLPLSSHDIGRALVCVSTSEELDGNAIRLVATILTSNRFDK